MNPFRFWQAGKEKPILQDQSEIDRLYKKYRISVMLAVTIGYGLAYPLRLALSAVKKPLIDGTALAGNVDFVIDMENKTITETSTPAVVIPDIRRGVPYGFSEIGYYPYYQRFLVDDFDAADADVGTSIYEITGIPASKITMVVYALSYGKKDYSVDLYSEAVYLGEIDVNFGW